jgi:hypothetical protein
VVVVNPLRVRRFAQADGTLAKTDRIDAHVLVRFGERLQPDPRKPRTAENRRLAACSARRPWDGISCAIRGLVVLRTSFLVSLSDLRPGDRGPCPRALRCQAPRSGLPAPNGSPGWPRFDDLGVGPGCRIPSIDLRVVARRIMNSPPARPPRRARARAGGNCAR